MKKVLGICSVCMLFSYWSIGQCKISQVKNADGSLFLSTENSLMYQTSKKKLVERLATDNENYFLEILPTPFLPKPAGSKVKKDLTVTLSNQKTYTLKHFDARYLDKDSSFSLLYLFNSKDIPDFKQYKISSIVLNDGTADNATYKLVLHPDAIQKQLACFNTSGKK
ncbi:MAG: hypothetical protein CFE25_04405 [Chitinophagaceae bacterium BSSC1]|nr:MAG: hypothetical protein CFE25_04405 [Chitinophagaceae bacterium BSSC1]